MKPKKIIIINEYTEKNKEMSKLTLHGFQKTKNKILMTVNQS